MKKANEVKNRFPNVKIGVYILDDDDTFVYRSDDNWPPEMQETIRAGEGNRKRKLLYGPTDFITLSEAIRANNTPATILGYGKLPWFLCFLSL
jgi:hypothetical protein